MEEIKFWVFLPIAGVVYLIGAGLKAIGNEKLDKFIPFLCGLSGGIISIVAYKTIPGFLPVGNWLNALYLGIGSGLMATGANQIYKQFTKQDEEFFEEDTNDELPVTEEETKDEGI